MAQRIEHHPLDAAFAALLSNGLDGAGEALRILVNEASKIERNHFLNARPHERTAERIDYANGFKPKTVMTRVGQLTFDVPQVRGGGFYPSALEKGTRTEQALNIALAEMYVQGVSTRKVTDILVKLLGPEVSISSTRSAAPPSSSMPVSRSGASGQEIGFYSLDQVENFGLFEDASSYLVLGVPISLNLIAEKWAPQATEQAGGAG